MAEIQQKDSGGKGGKKAKQKKVTLRVDFTPMVDMNMLLITFFMLATSMIKPQTMQISMPTKKKTNIENQNEVKASQAVTVYLGKDHKAYYFQGIADTQAKNFLKETDFSPIGLRQVLLDKNAATVAKVKELKAKKAAVQISPQDFDKQLSELRGGKETPVVVIKPMDNSTYEDMVNALDEMQIASIGKYAITDLDANDKSMLKNSGVEFEKK